MSAGPPPSAPSRRPPAAFTPRLTLCLFYVFGLFFLFALLLVTPTLVDAFQHLPAEADDRELELAQQIAQQTIRPRLGIALAGSVIATAVGAYTKKLPGL